MNIKEDSIIGKHQERGQYKEESKRKKHKPRSSKEVRGFYFLGNRSMKTTETEEKKRNKTKKVEWGRTQKRKTNTVWPNETKRNEKFKNNFLTNLIKN